MKRLLDSLRAKWHAFIPTLLDEACRKKFQLTMVYMIFAAVSIVMSVLNIFTREYTVLISTLIFAGVSLGNLYYITRPTASMAFSSALFCLSVTALFLFFIISGTPDGFSILWICLLPACGMLLLGRREGSIFFFFMLAVVIFFFQTELGRSLLLYDYGATFRTRYPLLLIAMYLVSLLLETVRIVTSDALEKSRRDYEYLCLHDALTGALNRHGFNQYLAEMPPAEPMTIMIMDIDDFKLVNDRFGHPVGDDVLRGVSEALTHALPPDARLYRWGGEEFAVILVGSDDAKQALALAEKLRLLVAGCAIPAKQQTVRVTVSVGAVTGVTSDDPGQTLLSAADDCLYEAKRTGKNRSVCRHIPPSTHRS